MKMGTEKIPRSLEGCMDLIEIISKKKDGLELDRQEIKYFVELVVQGKLQEAQIGAMLMAMCIQSLSINETAMLTEAFVESGEILEWPTEWNNVLVDKHSTGGVGDKVSIALVPALAACNAKVPMISGRGLGFTGGTLDKLESIPGFKVEQKVEDLKKILKEVGCFITSATENLAPGDRELYKFRNITGTVNNQKLITSSIASKKVAEGVKSLLMDIKVGKSAWCKDIHSARELANTLISVMKSFGISTRSALTRMDEPIGLTVGNALEIAESIESLQGAGPPLFRQLVCTLGGEILQMSNLAESVEQGKEMIQEALDSRQALKKFYLMLIAQGVSETTAESLCYKDKWNVLQRAKQTLLIKAQSSGWIKKIDGLALAHVAWALGAGRKNTEAKIDFSVGFQLLKTVGNRVEKNEPWIEVHYTDKMTDSQLKRIENSIEISESFIKTDDYLIEIIRSV